MSEEVFGIIKGTSVFCKLCDCSKFFVYTDDSDVTLICTRCGGITLSMFERLKKEEGA